MEDRILWQRHLVDLLEMEVEGGPMVRTDLIQPEEQVDGDHLGNGEGHLGYLLAHQVAERLLQVRQVFLGDRREDRMDLRMDLRMGLQVDLVTDHLDLLMAHPVDGRAVVVVDHPEDLLVEMDQEQGP